MNIFLWIVQGVLALLYVAGGAYKAFKVEHLAAYRELAPGTWRLLGVIELIGGILLVVPGSTVGVPGLNGIAAAVLALETIVVASVYGRHSTRLKAANPFTWAAAQAVMALIVAYGRM